MNGFNMICLFAAMLLVISAILFSQTKNTNTGLDYQAYERWVDNHTETLKEAGR